MFNYKWYMKDGYPANGVERHNAKVFGTFACGGGSTMGYKLAGYDVIGANDIDPQMAKLYKENHKPKHYFLNPINKLLEIDLPPELFDLDILDGSPPCSTFSTTGLREKAWKKSKTFREGQSEQVLSDLFFDYIALVDRLKPKIFIAENVKGMIIGNAKAYTKTILDRFGEIGYRTQLFLLNSATMGVPQRRERVFFIGIKKELYRKPLDLKFKEDPICFRDVERQIDYDREPVKTLTGLYIKYWHNAKPGEVVGKFQSARKIKPNEPVSTIVASHSGHFHYSQPRQLSESEFKLCGSFPLDYNFLDLEGKYIIGMSVPPVMMAQIANQVYLQWLKTEN